MIKKTVSLIIFLWTISVSAQPELLDTRVDEWVNLLNGVIEENSTDKIYLPVAVVDYTLGITQGKNIVNDLKTLKVLIGNIKSTELIGRTIGGDNNIMEIGKIFGELGSFGYTTAWRKIDNQYYIEYQIVKPINLDSSIDLEEVDQQRKEWELQSNNHRPDLVLQNVYHPEAFYLNRNELTKGRKAITERYGYMKNENWKITLTPNELLPVTSHLVMEIGIYRSNGEGQYLLIWEKDTDEKWMVSLDFNF